MLGTVQHQAKGKERAATDVGRPRRVWSLQSGTEHTLHQATLYYLLRLMYQIVYHYNSHSYPSTVGGIDF